MTIDEEINVLRARIKGLQDGSIYILEGPAMQFPTRDHPGFIKDPDHPGLLIDRADFREELTDWLIGAYRQRLRQLRDEEGIE